MSKIKLVVSDLHLGVGKYLAGGEINALEEFYYDDRFSEFLSYYTSGDYADAEVELILNGDIINFLQVDFRGHHLSVITESISLEKLKYIVAGHPVFFQALRKFAANLKNTVTYVVGNHDQCMMWPATRAYFCESVGSAVRFKNIVYFFDGVHVEHGHMHEAANRIDPKKFFIKKDVPEPILNLPLGSHFFIDFVLRVKIENPYIDKVRPFRNYIKWGLFFDTRFAFKTVIRLFSYFAARITGWRSPKKRWSLRRVLKIFADGAVFPDLGLSARKILEDDRVHTVIFGHSHVYQYRQWGRDKEYFNTGTWTELTSLDMTSLGKITKLTYVLIEYPPQMDSIRDESAAALSLTNSTFGVTSIATSGTIPASPTVKEIMRPRARLKHWRGFHRIEEDVDVS